MAYPHSIPPNHKYKLGDRVAFKCWPFARPIKYEGVITELSRLSYDRNDKPIYSIKPDGHKNSRRGVREADMSLLKRGKFVPTWEAANAGPDLVVDLREAREEIERLIKEVEYQSTLKSEAESAIKEYIERAEDADNSRCHAVYDAEDWKADNTRLRALIGTVGEPLAIHLSSNGPDYETCEWCKEDRLLSETGIFPHRNDAEFVCPWLLIQAEQQKGSE